MYAGHIATGIVLKAYNPTLPAFPIMIGVGLMDILHGPLTLMGVNTIKPNPSAGPYLFFDLDFMDFDHSLAAAVVISLIWGLMYRSDEKPNQGSIAALACFSHWICDWPLHNADLAAYPYSHEHFGYGLWAKWGIGAWVAEGVFTAVLVEIATRKFAERGVSIALPKVMVAVMMATLSPWSSPMQLVYTLNEPWYRIVYGVIITLGFVVPGVWMSVLLDNAEAVGVKRGQKKS